MVSPMRYRHCRCGARAEEVIGALPPVATRNYMRELAIIKIDVDGRPLCPWCSIPFPNLQGVTA